MTTISKEIAEKILKADINNIKAKAKAGKTLTAGERAIIAAQVNGTPATDVPKNGKAKNKAELARALGISRQRLNTISKKNNFPKPGDDGGYDVAACVAYLSSAGVKLDKEPGTVGELKAELLREQIRKLKFANEAEARKFISKDEIETELTRIISQFKAVLYSKLESELPPILEGMKAADIQVKMRDGIADAFGVLESDKWKKTFAKQSPAAQ